MDLGNHTYAHSDLHRTPLPQMQTQVIQGERTTRALVEGAGKKLQFFRHRFLHTGLTPDIRRQFEAFLTSRGYRIAPVTIDPGARAATGRKLPGRMTPDRSFLPRR